MLSSISLGNYTLVMTKMDTVIVLCVGGLFAAVLTDRHVKGPKGHQTPTGSLAQPEIEEGRGGQ